MVQVDHQFTLCNYGVYLRDLKYLKRPLSSYKESHYFVYLLTVATVVAGLSKYERILIIGDRRAKVYQEVFKIITEHSNYNDSVNDYRQMPLTVIQPLDSEDMNIYGDLTDNNEQ